MLPHIAARFDDAADYQRRIDALVPGRHLLAEAAAARLAVRQRAPAVVGVVGPGPGDELLTLADALPAARFEVFEVSDAMAEVCRQTVEAAGLSDRVVIHATALSGAEVSGWDAAVCLLVGHLLPAEQRMELVAALASRMRPDAVLCHAEIVCMPPLVRSAWLAWSEAAGVPLVGLRRLRENLSGGFPLWHGDEVLRLFRGAGFRLEASLVRSFGTVLWSLRRLPAEPAA